MTTKLLTKRIKAISPANNFHCFTYKMAAKTRLHRLETKLRHCHTMYTKALKYLSRLVLNIFIAMEVLTTHRLNGT